MDRPKRQRRQAEPIAPGMDVLLHELVQQGCQVVISTHSPLMLAYPDARIYLLGGVPHRIVETPGRW